MKSIKRGFTLLELIIVIAILAVLAVAVVIVLNPAEVLAKARDSNRLSDLSALKSAIALYLTDVSPPDLANGTGSVDCADGTAGKIFYSFPSDGNGKAIALPAAPPTMGADAGGTMAPMSVWIKQILTANLQSVTGTGWVPVNINNISPAGSPPLAVMPVDPTNKLSTSTNTSFNVNDLVYRYSCNQGKKLFEMVGNLESATYKNGGGQDRESTDGGQQSDLFETGTSLKIFPSVADPITLGW